MIIIRRTGSTILKLGKKNEKFRDDLLNLSLVIPTQNKYDLPKDILRLFDIERRYEAKLDRISFWTKRGVQTWVYSEKKVLDQFNSKKTPVGRKRTKEDRIILAYTAGTEYFAISWYIDDNKYKVSKEVIPCALLTKSTNRLFGKKNFNIFYETNSLQDAFRWVDSNALPTTMIVG